MDNRRETRRRPVGHGCGQYEQGRPYRPDKDIRREQRQSPGHQHHAPSGRQCGCPRPLSDRRTRFPDLRGRRCCPAGGRDTRVERRRRGRRRSLDYRRGGERNVHRIGTGQPRREQAYRKDYRDTLRTVRRSQSGHRGAGGQNRPAVADRHPDRPARMGIRRPQPGLPHRYRRKLHVDGQSRGRRGKSHRLDISHARQKRHAAQRPPRYAQYDRLVPFRIHHHLGRCRRRG